MINTEEFTEKFQAMLDRMDSSSEKIGYSKAIRECLFLNVAFINGRMFAMFSNVATADIEVFSKTARKGSRMLLGYKADDIDWLREGMAFSIETTKFNPPEYQVVTLEDISRLDSIKETSHILFLLPSLLEKDECELVSYEDYLEDKDFTLKTYAESEKTDNGKYETSFSMLFYKGICIATVDQCGKWSDLWLCKKVVSTVTTAAIGKLKAKYVLQDEVDFSLLSDEYEGSFYDEIAKNIRERI